MTSASLECPGSSEEPVLESIEHAGEGSTGLCPDCLGTFTLDERGLTPRHQPVLAKDPSPSVGFPTG
jgi:hypothetical protein